MTLIPNWKRSHKLWSVRLPMIGTAAGILMEYLPDMQDFMPKHWYIGIFIASVIVRIVAQRDAHE